MNNNKNIRILIVIDIILLILTVISYKIIFDFETNRTIYAEETSKMIEDVQNPIFKINKMVLWSSAFAVDNSNNELKDIDISQFTDMEIYIDNLSNINELTPENTVSEMFIDNIEIETDEMNRDLKLNYKNPYTCGKFVDLNNWDDGGIFFKVLNTNKKEDEADYNEAVFYTDCSNPITLGYVNKNFITHCEINGETGLINFDGSIISKTSQNMEKLNSKIKFDIHILNNYNESYICKAEVDIDLTENDYAINSGYLKKEIFFNDNELTFVKQH